MALNTTISQQAPAPALPLDTVPSATWQMLAHRAPTSELPKHLDATRLTQRALAEHGVSAIAGAAFYPRGIPAERNTMRLSFSMIPSEPARQGIARLGALASEMLNPPQR